VTSKFEDKMREERVAKDARTLADFIGIYCRGNHADRDRRPARTEGANLGTYGRKTAVLCEECEAHLAYGEKRNAFCPKDPKPFCAHCDVHCYRAEEREWQRQMMRYSGPRSMLHGHAIDGIRHVIATRRHKRSMQEAR
jgi:hypothetical protein